MDSLFLRGLSYEARHGVEDFEHQVSQTFGLSVELRGDFGRAIATDELAESVDYDAVERCLAREIHAKSFHLIEALASHLVAELFRSFPSVVEIRLELSKRPLLWEGKSYHSIGFSMERRRHDACLSLTRN
ncbi:MAG: dihydroneopterin aldolase [Puniceicoccales bacterium]|jgi:dihydroneopterin aldolase|nr:dihydroneopterin aldolase [Puniceicoccales bacterium]